MTYKETIQYLYAQLPAFTRMGKAAYKKDLHNISKLCHFLGHPQKKFKTIHVAGTNGKGSTSHLLAAILQKQGYPCGLYTSPHIKDFRERIRINGEPISKIFVINFVKKIKAFIETIQPSFFEVTVAMAFEYFAEKKITIAVIETGLGGRLDSTNIINPLLSVITNIGYDHTDILGNTLPKIAFEKAGIIKENTPVVIGERHKTTAAVFKKAAKLKQAPIFFADEFYLPINKKIKNNKLYARYVEVTSQQEKTFVSDVLGTYQMKNLATVLTSVAVLNKTGFKISKTALVNGLAKAKVITGLIGRWQILQTQPTVIVDVAHNANGIEAVVHQLKENYPGQKIHFVLGFVKDKSLEKVIPLFPKKAAYYFTQAAIFRALPKVTLQKAFELKGRYGTCFDNVNQALTQAKKQAGPQDVIMVCGSFYIIAELKNL